MLCPKPCERHGLSRQSVPRKTRPQSQLTRSAIVRTLFAGLTDGLDVCAGPDSERGRLAH